MFNHNSRFYEDGAEAAGGASDATEAADVSAETAAAEVPAAEKATEAEAVDANKPNLQITATSGEVYNVNAREYMALAQMGLEKYLDKDAPPAEAKEAPVTEEVDDMTVLKKEIESLKRERAEEKQNMTINQVLNTSVQKYAETKEDSDLANDMMALALSRYQMNSRIPLDEHFDHAMSRYQKQMTKLEEKAQKKAVANSKVKANVEGIIRGEGGVPQLDLEKPLTFEDVKKGVSREKLEQLFMLADQEE